MFVPLEHEGDEVAVDVSDGEAVELDEILDDSGLEGLILLEDIYSNVVDHNRYVQIHYLSRSSSTSSSKLEAYDHSQAFL